MIRSKNKSLSEQMIERSKKEVKKEKEFDGNTETMISTGSTLLDLAISGGRKRGGGIPGGIVIEAFGPSSSGKTVLLCEIAGAIQRQGGEIMFHDPEARLNAQFAQIFDVDMSVVKHTKPDTVTEVFESIKDWEPSNPKKINGIMTDSLAALSTKMEMEKDEGDKMGMRRAKEFSEGFRKTCRLITQKNQLLVCSNQVRVNVDAGPYAQKYTTPGGEAMGFYASLRLRFSKPEKIKIEVPFGDKKITRVIGVESTIEVFKSTVWKPYRTAPLTILFDYGIDDVRQNLQFIKDYTKNTQFTVNGEIMNSSMEKAIKAVEGKGLVKALRNQTIDLWEEMEAKVELSQERKPKRR